MHVVWLDCYFTGSRRDTDTSRRHQVRLTKCLTDQRKLAMLFYICVFIRAFVLVIVVMCELSLGCGHLRVDTCEWSGHMAVDTWEWTGGGGEGRGEGAKGFVSSHFGLIR